VSTAREALKGFAPRELTAGANLIGHGHGNHIEVIDATEVIGVAGVDGEVVGEGGCSDRHSRACIQ
jgi:hypothetical protein